MRHMGAAASPVFQETARRATTVGRTSFGTDCGSGLAHAGRSWPNPDLERKRAAFGRPFLYSTCGFAGSSVKRMMGLEPTTFCMASRRSSQLSYIRADADYSFSFPRPGPR